MMCVLHNSPTCIWSHNAPLLRVTLQCRSGCKRHYVICAARSSLNWHRSIVQGWPALHRHMTLDPDKSWPLHIRDRWNAVTRCQKLHSVCMCVCLFASLSERRRWPVRSQLCWSTSSAYSSCLRSPWDKWEKSDCLLQINTVKKTCTLTTHKHTRMLTTARRLRWEGSWRIMFSDVHQLSILTSDLTLPRQHPPSDQTGARHRSITATCSHTAHIHGHCSDAL